MKKIIQGLLVASVFAACNGNSKTNLDTNKQVMPLTDSAMVYNNSILTDTGRMIVSDPAHNAINKSSGNVAPMAPHRLNSPVPAISSHSHGTSNTGTGRSQSSSGGSDVIYTEPAPSRPRGISSAAKDAAIGGVGGAVLGGVIGKGKGAVIGGVIGAGGGYAIGRSKDRRTGRVAQGRRYRRYRRSY